MAKVTNKDIAKCAGVSQAAVSMAIHGKKGISEATRAHILQIVREMNYEPPVRSHTSPAGAVVLLVDSLTDRIAPPLLKGLLELAVQQDAELKLCSLSQALDDPQGRLAGCSLLVTLGEVERASLNLFASLAARVLVIDGNFSRKPFLNIRTDYAGAAYALTAHLKELGHRNFLYLNQDLPPAKNLICFSGFQRLCLELHLPVNPEQIVMDAGSDPNVWSHVPDIIRANNISAVVCTSDQAAVRAVNLLEAVGLQVPEDVSVAAVTDGDAAMHPRFSFTGVSLNTGRLGAELLRLAVKTKLSPEDYDVVLPVGPVTPGSSTAAPRFNPAAKKLAIALILKDHPTYRVVRAGFLKQIQEMGYQAEVVGIPDNDETAYLEICRQLRSLHVDGAVVWLPVPEAVRALAEAGIPVVCPHNIIQDALPEGTCAGLAADPQRIAQTVADYFTEHLRGRTGSLAVSQADDSALEAAITRAFIPLMRQTCPQITVLDDLRFVNHTEENTQLVRRFIERTPDLLGAFSTAGAACITWAAARRAAGKDGMVIVGTDYTEETVELIESGEVQAFVAQPVYEEAQMSVVALDALLRGNGFPRFSTLDAPLVTRETVEKYRRLLQEVRNWYV